MLNSRRKKYSRAGETRKTEDMVGRGKVMGGCGGVRWRAMGKNSL